MPQGRGGNAALQELNWVLSGIIFSLSDLVPGSILSEPCDKRDLSLWHEQYPDAGKAGAGTKGLEFLFAALPLALTQATIVAAPRGRRISAGQLFAVSTERARAREHAGRRKFHTPHYPYQGGEEPPGPVRTAPAERRPKADSVSANSTPPKHKPLRIKAAKSRPVRSGPPPRSEGRSSTA